MRVLSKRLQVLLTRAGDTLLQGGNPFSGEFYADNKMDHGEKEQLRNMAGAVLIGFTSVPLEAQKTVIQGYVMASPEREETAIEPPLQKTYCRQRSRRINKNQMELFS